MDQAIRNKLRNVVTQCRKLLEEAVSQVLQGQFGIYGSAKKDEVQVEDEARMQNLSEEDKGYRRDILAHLEHIEALGYKPKDALAQLVRETAFTHLNRFCAYKMMEAREVWVGGQRFREAVSRGLKSQGFQFYLADHPEDKKRFDSGHQDVACRHFLAWLGALLSEEIGVLFSPTDPANRLFPPQRVLDDVLALLNSDDLKDIWSQDETIGWVYQYFTPKELRDQVRKESQAPRNSYELAFRNQFFTPRYVVEFLTDNTLGRIWYEMRKGDTKLKDQCRYLLRRPSEVFLAEGQSPPEPSQNQDELSQQEFLKQPVHIPFRPKKDPRELRILDPACGSGHFLLYCFDLLLTIYEEAYADPNLGPKLKEEYPTLDALRRDVPRLILAHNLHGIDIDLRCTQIAALALWLRCQRAYRDMGLKQDRPRITKSNIVCAEPMPGESEMLKEFVPQLQPKVLGHLVEVVFEKMKLAGEAGPLLKISDELKDAIAESKRQWTAEHEQAVDRKGRPLLFSRAEMERMANKTPQPRLFDLTDMTDEQFWHEAEDRVLAALRDYATHATNSGRLKRQLFVEDAAQGFAFIDLCQRRFDVVLMNPPFGSPSLVAEPYLHARFPESKYECYGQFLSWGLSVCQGLLGAITSRGFLYLANFMPIRAFVYPHLRTFLDLGEGVLDDAMVEVAAYVLSSKDKSHHVYCVDARTPLNANGNDRVTPDMIGDPARTYLFDPKAVRSIESIPFCYTTPPSLLRLFGSSMTIERMLGGLAKVGLATGDNDRFVRCYWEVPVNSINRRWRWHAKGGDYLPFKSDVHLVVDWADDGKPIEEAFVGARIRKTDVYFRPGVTYSLRSLKGLSFRVLPGGTICSNKGPVIIAPGHEYSLLALFNSRVFKYLVEIQCAFGAYEIGTIQRAPLPASFLEIEGRLSSLGRQLLATFSSLEALDETGVYFQPWFFQHKTTSLAALASWIEDQNLKLKREGRELLQAVESEVCGAYQTGVLEGTSAEHEKMLELFDISDTEPQVARLVISVSCGCVFGQNPSSTLKTSLSPPDFLADLPQGQRLASAHSDGVSGHPKAQSDVGIIPDDLDHPSDIVRRVREVLELIWREQAEAIEKEACGILGVKELRDYFRKPGKGGFWDDHVSSYSKSRRKAPIYWLLQSSKRNYALWVYYHRLDKDILFKALVNFVEPKIRLEQSRLDSLRSQKTALGAAKGAKKIDKDIERQDALLVELKDFEEKLRRAANLDFGKNLDSSVIYDPDLNDGVVLNIAPLWELVPWKEAKNYWEELMAGEYEWSSMGKLLRKKGLVK